MGHEQPREVHFGLRYLPLTVAALAWPFWTMLSLQVGAGGVIYISLTLLYTLGAVGGLKPPWQERKEMVNG